MKEIFKKPDSAELHFQSIGHFYYMTYIQTKSNQRIKDYTGFKKGYLEAISFEFVKNNSTYWKFKCDCGNYKILKSNKVLSKNSTTKSCGCLKKENTNSAFKLILRTYKNGANRRNLSFELTEEQFKTITSKSCHYCGIIPSKTSKTPISIYNYNGIDRKNNSIGYTIENSLPCCTLCNKAKRDLDYNIFINWIKQIKNFNNKSL